MIAKHVPMRSLGKSDFAGLVKYITADQAKEHRIGEVRLTNCAALTVRDAVTEVLATQQANTRAKSDKTYHLLVSFRAGELPDAATLEAIEARICAGLGFSDHQRVSAVHHDTDIRAAIDTRLPITFDDPSMERLRQQYMTASLPTRASRLAVKPVGQEPPPQARNRLRTLFQLEALSIKGGDQTASRHPAQSPIAGDPARRQVEQVAQQAVSRFKAAANRRKVRAIGYGDQGKAWKNLPDELRQRIDLFNSQPPDRQEIELARMRREVAEHRGGDLSSSDGATKQKGRSR